MRIIRRFAHRLLFRRHASPPPLAAGAELWCRPATVLALRDRRLAGRCVAGWR
jgi:hypothetical protein